MAIDQLGIYNNALFLLGERKLASLSEGGVGDDLDEVYDLDAINYCLEITRPKFATTTKKLTTSSTSAEHDLDNVFDLPTDYVNLIGVFSDSKLDQPVSRYILEADDTNKKIACEHSTIYVRYTTNLRALTAWTPSFVRVISAYLARELCIKIAPQKYEDINTLFVDRVEAALQIEGEKDPKDRPSRTTFTMSNAWRYIYNDALFIMGLDEIVANDDDSNRRTKLDRVIEMGVVNDLLEDTGWTFGLTSDKVQYDPNLEPDWGHKYVFGKPTKLHRLHGLFQDEYMRVPLKEYIDEGSYWFCDLTEIYVQYVSTDFLNNPSNWPVMFRRLVAARMAKDAAASLKKEGANPKEAHEEYERRKADAMANDAMSAPPQKIHGGSWVQSRFNPYRGGTRGRP